MNDLRGKKLLLLGGVQPMCEVVKEARKLGVIVYVTDYLEDSPAKKIADKSFLVSTTDVDRIVDLCLKEGVNGVFTGYTDSMLPYCRQICDRLGFPFWGNEKNVEKCIDKTKFKLMCEEVGIKVVPWKIANADNYNEVKDQLNFPVVIKPVDNSGSRGVYKCFSKEKYNDLCKKSLAFSKKGEIMIERMMNLNNEFSVYYMLYKGKAYLSQSGDRYVHAVDSNKAPIGQGMSFPSIHLNEWINKMEPLMKNLFKRNEMNDGFVFMQGFYENGDFFMHEAGYRLAGGFAYKYVDWMSGYNQVQQLIRYSLTGEMQLTEIEKSNPFFCKNTFLLTVAMNPGKIDSIEGLEEIENISGVMEVCQLHFVGDDISSVGATSRVFAYILCVIDSKKQLSELIEKIATALVVKNTQSQNMLTELISPDKIHLFYEDENTNR